MTDNNTALKKAGLKVTLPRLKILEVLQEPDNHHVSAEDLYKRLIDMGEEIGLATVYRVLNQFDDAGIVTRHNFEGGKSVFELTQQHHHDHLICLDCGKVIEFSDDSIEARQREIAAKHQQFADQESVRVLDYQQCLRATQTGNDQAVKADCDKVWQEIRSNNK
ncbi:ferric iron uptake transcriptional regulator [Escherichia sp. SS-MK2]